MSRDLVRPSYGSKVTGLPDGGFVIGADVEAFTVRGTPYWLAPDAIRTLKREGRLDDAVEYLCEIVECLERYDRNWTGERPPTCPIPPWYYEQLAIIYRKQRKYDAEVEVIQRFQQFGPYLQRGTTLSDRMPKALALLEASRSQR